MSQTYTPPPPATSGRFALLHRWIPLVAWAASTFVAGSFVLMLGTNAPYADEWEFVPILVGENPDDNPILPWLWQQHNEHRLPLPRAVYLVLFKLTHDFRAGMFLQVAMLSALAFFLMRYAVRLRGKPHWADAFFPISMLHIGHWENFIMGYQICFVLFAALVAALAVVALRITRENAFRSGVIAGTLLMLIALTGGSGLAVILPVAAWLMFVAVSVWRGGRKDRAALLVLLAALPVAYLGVYFVGYEKPAGHPELGTNPLEVAPRVGAVLALAPGVGLSPLWWAVCIGELVLGVWTILLLVRRGRGEYLSTSGLIAVAAGVAGVSLAIGMARAEWDIEKQLLMFSRYSLLTWPLLATTYLVWVRFGRKWVPIGLCVVAAAAFPGNTGTGMFNGAAIRGEYSEIEGDIVRGRTAEEIVAREQKRYNSKPDNEKPAIVLQTVDDRSVKGIPMLRKARIGIFAR